VPTEGFLFTEHWHDIAPPEPEATPGEGAEAAGQDEAEKKPGS
jgi:hypothetical protein